jgi:hypothetical protein
MRQQAASWPNENLAAKVSPLVVNLKRLMVRPNPGDEPHKRLRNSRPDNDAKTILDASLVFFSLRAKRHVFGGRFPISRPAFRNWSYVGAGAPPLTTRASPARSA